MATFDPDAYLAKKQAFDPDAYLAKGQTADAPTMGGMIKDELMRQVRGVRDFAAGATRGAGSIGATILAPKDALEAYIARSMGADLPAPERRNAMTQALGSMGADTDSLAFGAGKLGTEIAGTAGVGGAAANTLARIPGAATSMPAVIQAMRTGGFSTGTKAAPGLAGWAANMAPRITGGAVAGGAAAGLVDPEYAATGALIGGALPPAVQGAGKLGSLTKKAAAGLTKHTLGASTGTGAESVGTAYQAGKQGGTSFLDNLRGKVPFTDVLDEAKAALSHMRINKSNQYKQGMAGVSADKTVIDFTPIDSAVGSLKSMGNYKGQVINKNASGTVDEIADLVGQWKALDPADFHTPEGLDALKQAISDIRDTTQLGTAARKAADTAYNAVKGEITKQAPTYAKVMKDYSEATELVKEIERSLVGNQKTAADTAMRKLQSLMRNNVNTNYGNRLDLAKVLEINGAEILPAVAGQSMSSFVPRGLQGLSASGIAGAGVLTSNPLALAMLPMTSPRLVGEAAYGLGAMNRGIGGAAASGRNQLAQLLAQTNGAPLTMNRLAPLLATGSVLSANQK
jgi:hypothetical protein